MQVQGDLFRPSCTAAEGQEEAAVAGGFEARPLRASAPVGLKIACEKTTEICLKSTPDEVKTMPFCKMLHFCNADRNSLCWSGVGRPG